MNYTLPNPKNLTFQDLWLEWFQKQRWKILGLLILLSLALQIRVASICWIPQRDAIYFISLAKEALKGAYQPLLLSDQHPLFPVLIAIFSTFFENELIAAQCIAIFCNTLTIIPLFFLIQDLTEIRIAIIGSALYALHPSLTHYSAGALSEPMMILFLVTGVWLGWKVINGNNHSALWAGLCAGGAYLTRPEGGLALATIGIGILALRSVNRTKKQILICFVLLLSGFGSMALPYIIYISKTTGYISLSMKKNKEWASIIGIKNPWTHDSLMTPEAKKEKEKIKNDIVFYLRDKYTGHKDKKYFKSPEGSQGKISVHKTKYFNQQDELKKNFFLRVLGLMNQVFTGFFYPVAIALIVGLIFARFSQTERKGEVYLGITVLLFLTLIAIVEFNSPYQSKRHLVYLIPFILPWAALGPQSFAKLFKPWWWLRLIIFFCLTQLMFNFLPFKALRPDKAGISLVEKNLGEMIKERWGKGKVILTSLNRVSFYAEGKVVDIPDYEGLAGIMESILENKVEFIAVDQKHVFMVQKFADWGMVDQVFPEGRNNRLKKDDIVLFKVDPFRIKKEIFSTSSKPDK